MLIALLSTLSLILVVLSIIQQRKIRALRQDRQTFRTLVENSPDHIIRYDREGRRVYVNSAVARLWGVPVEELIGKAPEENPLLDSAQNRSVVEGIRRVFETGETGVVEMTFTDPEGRPRGYNMLLIPEFNTEGQVETVLSLNRDVTVLREAERTVSNLVAQLPGFVFKFHRSADGYMSYPFASPRVEEYFGLRPEDIAHDATPVYAMAHPEDAPRIIQAIAESARTMSSSHVEYRLLRPGHPERWMEVIATPAAEADGSVLWYGIQLDITERKRLQDELADARNFLDRIIDTIADPIFVKDREHRWIHLNEASCRLFGGTREELIGKSDFDIFPEHEARAFWEGDEAVFTDDKEFASEERITNKLGEQRYIYTRKRTFIDMHGHPILVGVITDITERKRLQDELADAQNFLDRIIDTVADPIFVKDRQHRWIHVNEAFCRLTGGTREELIGKSDFDFFPEKEARSFWEGDDVVFTSGKEFASEDEINGNKPGEKRYTFARKTMFIDSHGSPILVGVISDVTEHKRLQHELADSQNFLDRIINATIDPIFVKDRQHRWILVNDAFCQLLGSTREELIGKSDFDFFPEEQARFFWEGDELVFTEGKDFAREEEITTKGGEKRYIFTRKRAFTDARGKQNLTAVITDITERRRMELLLATRERELRSLMEHLPANIARYTPGARNLYTNPMLERTLDTSRDDLLGRTPMEAFPDGHYSEYQRRILATAASGGSDEMEVSIPNADGEMTYHIIRFVAEHDEKGAVTSVLVIGTDISERKRAEIQLATRERELRTLMENIPDNIVRFTPDARYLYTNPVLERTTGKRYELLQGKTIMECFPDGRYAEIERRVIAAGASGSNDEMEMEVLVADGEVEYHLIRFIPERDEKDEVVSVLIIGTDITERRRAELALAAREREFRRLAENLPDNIIRYDQEGVAIYVNPVLERTLGKSAATRIGKTTREYHPDGSFEDYAQLLDAVLASGEAGEIEKLLPDRNGETRVNQIRLVPEFDGNGKVVGVLTIGRDITESRRAEEKLRLAASVFTSTSEGIIVSDTDNRILDVNEAFTRITGYTREEVIGKDPNLLSSGRQGPEFYAEMWRTLQQTGHWVGEVWNRRKDGEEYAEWLTISVVNDEQGKLSHHVAVFTDITLIKEQERQLQRIAHHDALTGLPNRLLFLDRLKQAVAQTRRSGGLLAVCYGDLDGFKPVNDRYGHEAGDNVLVTIGNRMQESVRAGDTVGRIGGDEFVILLMDLESVEECGRILTRLLDAVAQPIQLNGHSVSVSASLGVTLFPQVDADPDILLRHADQAMYQAKRRGKSIIRFFDPDHP